MQLRPYQEELVGSVLAARERRLQRVLAAAPTGTGKTVSFVALHNQWPDEGKTLVLAHREELLQQAAASFQRADPHCWVETEQASRKAGMLGNVIVASTPTVGRPGSRRLDWLRPKLVILDEAHHAPSPTAMNALRRFGCFAPGGPFLLGVTATPKRLDRLNLAAVFEEQIYSYGIRDAIEDGWLSDIRGYRVESKTDLGKVKSTAGDFNAGQLEQAVDNEERTEAAVDAWLKVAAGRRTVAFCAGVAHAEHTAAAFRERGIAAEHVTGTTDRETRREILGRLRSGETTVLTNVDILTEGFDLPALSCILMLRPTQSWTLYMQCIGRGTRLAPGKSDLLVLDVTDNCERHSLAALPAILDLPPDLDLQGNSLAAAARKLDELGSRAAALADHQPRLFSEIETLLRQVDLLAYAGPPREVRDAGCKLEWQKLSGSVYGVSCGRTRSGGKREARLTCDQLGRWTLTLSEGGRIVSRGCRPLGEELKPALFLSDHAARRRWPDAEAAPEHQWRRRSVTESQGRALRRFGVEPAVIAALDRGGASGMLTQLVAGKERA